MASREDDAATPRSFDASDVDESFELDDFEIGALEGSLSRAEAGRMSLGSGSDGSSATTPTATATRLMEALEALSSETGEAMPPSLRSLLGQLQNDDQAMAGLFPFMRLLDPHHSGGGGSRFQRMLQSLDADAPPHVQLSALSELCESLSLSSEEGLVVSGFSVDKFLPPILRLIRAPPTMDVLLLAARALSSVFDMFASAAIPKAMSDDAFVPSICEKLIEIEYMDVAEMAFQILERVVTFAQHEQPSTRADGASSSPADYRRTVIAANGFMALLQFIDFFPIEIQRTAARVVAGLCANIGAESARELQVALPMVANLVRSSDKEIVEAGCRSYRLLASSPAFAKDSAFATLVASEGAVDAMVDLLAAFASRSESSTKLSSAACTSVIEFLTAILLSPHSDFRALIHDLRHTRLPPLVSQLLESDTITDDVTLLRDALKLVMTILPPSAGSSLGDILSSFSRSILPCIFHIYEVSLRTNVRLDCLRVIQRVSLMPSPPRDSDEGAAELSKVSSFLARVLQPGGVITHEQSKNLCVALQIVQVYLQSEHGDKNMASTFFERYGVNAAVRVHAESNEAEDVTALAKLLVAECMQDGEESGPADQLRSAVRKLEAALDDLCHDGLVGRDAMLSALRQLLEISGENAHMPSSGGTWVTAHEIVSTGFASTLAKLLENDESRDIFADFCFGQNVARDFIDGLVACLHDAVSVEKSAFGVGVTFSQSQIPVSTGSVSGDIEQLTQHIKVRVKIDDELAGADADKLKRSKRAVHDTVVLVEPLARVETIEEFISEKLFGTRTSLDFFDDEAMEELGTPRSHRRRRRNRTDGEEKHSEDEENEDHDEDHDEEDHSEVEDEGDSEDESEDEHDDLRNDRPRKQKRLQMIYRGVALKSGMSVLEALLQKHECTRSQESSSSTVKDLTRIWTGSPHEFVFRVLGQTQKSQDKAQTTDNVLPSGDSEVADEKQVWELLRVLKHLHDISTNANPASIVTRASQSDRFINSFVSLQVNRALTQPIRVMTNSLPKWCYRVVEEFPFILDYDTRYDFKYATISGAARAISYLCRTLWKKTATAEESSPAASRNGSLSTRSTRRSRERGSTSRSPTAALTNLSRMAKLPRLKVRVARARLLQSAMKLFTMYGGKKAIIEIEFLGEVGTGLGPTTEFYTLVCHELQGTQLKLWRSDKDTPGDDRTTDEPTDAGVTNDEPKEKKPGLPIRGYHRVAVYHCTSCKILEIPRCAIHDQLLTHEKKSSEEGESESSQSIPQCSMCLDSRDWHSTYNECQICYNRGKASEVDAQAPAAAAGEENNKSGSDSSTSRNCHLKWWIMSEEEISYLQKVYPREAESIKHPVLQCSHCDSVNFPGTDAGIVVLDHSGQKMISRTGRRMHERDYRAVTKHVSPLCEGTPLKQIGVVLTREAVETLFDCAKKSPELLDSDVESLSYLSEVALQGEITVVDASFGLYPVPFVPLDDSQKKKKSEKDHGGKPIIPDAISWFDFMGRFVAQAILDERLLNLPLARTFIRALRGEKLVGDDVSISQSIAFVREFDPAIAQSLQYLHELTVQATAEADTAVMDSKKALVESMCLSFTLVGDASIELSENGAARDVELSNLDEYVQLNLRFLLHETIHRQIAAFHEGFESIVRCTSAKKFLQSFTLQELEFLLADKCLTGDSMWGRDGKELRDAMVCDHGYTPHSRAIHDLVAVLCEMTLDEQRLFVKFVTGANRLPLGGLAKLEPKLTVVRKLASDGNDTSVDSVLPSASTCTNYLKLPEYSTRAIMRDRLLYCIHEGQGSFHLS